MYARTMVLLNDNVTFPDELLFEGGGTGQMVAGRGSFNNPCRLPVPLRLPDNRLSPADAIVLHCHDC